MGKLKIKKITRGDVSRFFNKLDKGLLKASRPIKNIGRGLMLAAPLGGPTFGPAIMATGSGLSAAGTAIPGVSALAHEISDSVGRNKSQFRTRAGTANAVTDMVRYGTRGTKPNNGGVNFA
jgi:hypothetical protein